MLSINRVDTASRRQVKRFVEFQYQHYQGHPQWVPPIRADIRLMLDREKHPFYEHSDADFFIAERDGQDMGRIAVLENRSFNAYHDTRQAQFYLFECEDNLETAEALFSRAFEWAHRRGLDTMVGPKGFGPFDGYGIQIEGFEHRQMMTMMNYNYAYYPTLMEALGFEKEVDFVSCYIDLRTFEVPERIHRIARRVEKRGTLRVKRFSSKKELLKWAPTIGRAYNETFINNWEYYPLTDREVEFLVDNLMMVAKPDLIKIITHGDDLVGFLFGFPDLSKGLQRANGRLLPLGILHLLRSLRRTNWISLNGVGILPEFQGMGGNALLYSEVAQTILSGQFDHAELTQVAESAVNMRHDLIRLGGKPYKNHRVYTRAI